MLTLNNTWDEFLKLETSKQYFLNLEKIIKEEYKNKLVYPSYDKIYRALELTDFKDLKIVILGQDPYHGAGQAEGLAFSVGEAIKFPPSLRNIFKELKSEYNFEIPKNGSLVSWAKQGILLLNTSLTVVEANPNSHSKLGWETFTDEIIKYINKNKKDIIFVLWGNNARKKKQYIDEDRHLVLEAAHPSPLSASRGFFGCGHFKKINEKLKDLNLKEIDWNL